MALQKWMLDILACPRCLGDLVITSRFKEKAILSRLMCKSCKTTFNVKNDIPDMRIKECLKTTNKIQRLFYNLYAPFYDKWEARLAKLYGFTEKTLREELVRSIEIESDDKILEICIGTGGNVPYFREYTSNIIIGVDISERMLEVCRRKVKDNYIGLILGCAEYLPLKTEVFNKVLIGGALSYMSDPMRALREALRVVCRNGIVVVYDQITVFDKLLGKDRLPLKRIDTNVKLIEHKYLFNKHFYIAKYIKQS